MILDEKFVILKENTRQVTDVLNQGIMKWQGARRSGNVEDKRGMSGGKKLAFGGIGGIIVLIIGFLMGRSHAVT